MTDSPGLEDRVAALEAAVAQLVQPEPDFMARTRVDVYRTNKVESVRLTHEPTGVTITAPDRAEAVYKLRKALAGEARRLYDIQEQERRRRRETARNAT